jgi:uncharacterized membrane protein
MRLLPLLIMSLVFLLMAIIIAETIGLAKSGYRNLFVLAWMLLGTLIGWRIALDRSER